jgi:hypothetical protein
MDTKPLSFILVDDQRRFFGWLGTRSASMNAASAGET